MSNKTTFAIGALGGSSTRAVAKIFMDLGVEMGAELNGANDNLLFSRLFKDPLFYQSRNKIKFTKRLKFFYKLMSSSNDISYFEKRKLIKICLENKCFPSSSEDVKKFIKSRVKRSFNGSSLWGWKEPNTHLYLEDLLEYDKGFKYVHVLRNGLDMAYSSNRQQLMNWGDYFGVKVLDDDEEQQIIIKQLKYWVLSTKRVLNFKEQYPDRILIINQNKLVESPVATIEKLLRFIEKSLLSELNENILNIPKLPLTNDRYKNKDLSIFDQSDINFVANLGFKVD